MKGSGLSLERFIQGKAHKTKAQAKSKKKVIIHKATRKREYERVKKHESASASEETHPSFYDRFFQELQQESEV